MNFNQYRQSQSFLKKLKELDQIAYNWDLPDRFNTLGHLYDQLDLFNKELVWVNDWVYDPVHGNGIVVYLNIDEGYLVVRFDSFLSVLYTDENINVLSKCIK